MDPLANRQEAVDAAFRRPIEHGRPGGVHRLLILADLQRYKSRSQASQQDGVLGSQLERTAIAQDRRRPSRRVQPGSERQPDDPAIKPLCLQAAQNPNWSYGRVRMPTGTLPAMLRTQMQPSRTAVDLYWIPLGAGGHCVGFNGRVFEAIEAARQHRRRCDLYHAALVVELDGDL